MTAFTESVVEDATLAWLEKLGYAVLHGPQIALGEPAAEADRPAVRGDIPHFRVRNIGTPNIVRVFAGG